MNHKRQELENKLKSIDQQHVLSFWSECSESEKNRLTEQIENLDCDRVRQFQKLISHKSSNKPEKAQITPLPVIPLPQTPEQKKQHFQYYKTGETALKEGKVAVVLVAGGQGSRLGFNHPKGMFPLGPVTNRSLFQYHTEKILALERMYQTTIPFYIMTSKTNDTETRTFFNENHFFGKESSSVHFFRQNMLPAMDSMGRLLLKNKYELFTSPDGHGGTINALRENGLFEDMDKQEVEYVFYFQVDNPLVKVCDPEYLGAHIENQAEMSAKTIYKRSWDEKLGVPVNRNGKNVVVEYSELSEDDKKSTHSNGTWVFGQGSIAIHVFRVDFLKKLTTKEKELPIHLAHKKIEYIKPDGSRVKPEKPNAYKFEQFIFDAMPEAANVMIMETERSKEFSPIKNKTGEDSPESAKYDLSAIFADWLQQAGVRGLFDQKGSLNQHIEIGPLFAMSAEEVAKKLPNNFKPQGDIILD